MKTEVKKLDSTKCEINVAVSGELVKNKFESVFSQVSKEAKVPGFRPGKAPRDVLEKHYAPAVHEQVLKELVPDVYNQAIEEVKLDVIELPQITDVKLDRNNLSFKAVVEVTPEIAVKNYKNQKINFKTISVSADEIKRQIDSIRESRKAEGLDDKFCRSLGYPNVAELEKAVERQIFITKENQERARIENELIENTMKGLEFKLPQSLVDRQTQDTLRQTKIDLAMKGVPRDKIEEQEKLLLEKITPEAKNQVKVYLVLSQIAKKENISIDDHMPRKVMEFLLREADWQVTS
ncbi:MAG: trigger factor [Candidatus Omnitrophica bacterium]|jgi:FKBP-type peptidyl-prolyl cis-trans isomerase (trigger factor)|nr:trigger factor [Candidatus Omnitrophota bacterium]MDD5660729.1 trigger factor [Candidatus Omnitrophota bacterium]